MKMAPAHLKGLLEIHTNPNYEVSVAVLADLKSLGLLNFNSIDSRYCTSPKGDVYVQMLCDTPVPVPVSVVRWVDPRVEGQER